MQGYVNEYLGEHPVQLDKTLTDNTKAAPAGVVGELKSDLGELEDVLEDANIKLYIDSEQFSFNGYLQPNGNYKDLAGFWCTDFIETQNGQVIVSGSIGDVVEQVLPNICLYNENKAFIKKIKFDFDGSNIIKTSYDFGSAKYIRVVTSQPKKNTSWFRLVKTVNSDKMQKDISDIQDDVIRIDSDLFSQDVRISSIEDSFVDKREENGANYNTYTIGGAMSATWFGIGSEVIVPDGTTELGIEAKVDGDVDVLVEMLENNIVIYSKTEHVNTTDKILFTIPCVDKDGKNVVVRISTETSAHIHLLVPNSIVFSDYAVQDAYYAKNSYSWGKYTLVQYSVPVLFFKNKKVLDIPVDDKLLCNSENPVQNKVLYELLSGLVKNDIEIHRIPSIYTIQYSDDMQKSPSLGIYVDSVIKGKQDVSFDGIDRAYLAVPNKTQTNDIVEMTESFVLSGKGYSDKPFTVKNISVKTTNLANKTAKVLQIGDSVTNGAGSQYNTDDKPQRSWAYLAYLGKKYLSSYEQLGKIVSETITLADGSSYTAKAEGRGGWKLYDYMYVADKTVDDVNLVNPFYNANKVWTRQELNTKGVKFSLAYYLSQTGVETPTHVVLQLGFNDAVSDNFVENMGLIIEAIKEEYPNMIIGISHIRDYGIFYQKYYPNLVPNASCWHNALYDKMSDRVEQIMEMEDASNGVYFIPTYFISPTGDSIPTYRIDDKDVAFRVDSTYHPNHKAHVEWGKEMFAWLAYTLLK